MPPEAAPPLTVCGFVLRAALWLAPCFAAWHFLAPALAGLLAHPVGWLLPAFLGEDLRRVVASAGDLAVVLAGNPAAFAGQRVELELSVNPRLYTYGLPVVSALMLASRASIGALAAAIVLLVPFQAWGVTADILRQVAFAKVNGMPALPWLGPGTREAVALAYQIGSLVLPPVAPVVVWGVFNARWVLAGRPPAPAAAPPSASGSPGP